MRARDYIAIARPDHWFKNVFMLPGTALAAYVTETPFSRVWLPLLLGIASTCLVASANYVINEWLDAEFDRFHPNKRNRPSVARQLDARVVYAEYALLLAAGLALGLAISPAFAITAALLALMGVLYNVRPFRTKERVYLDVLSESINNPLRLALGWFVVTSAVFPPSSLLVGYWMAGAFLMGIKRYAELRFIGDPERAALYRASFRYYDEESLLISVFFYGACASFFLGVFLVKYRLELLLSLPFLALLFAWYLRIGMRENSPAQHPERLYRERGFLVYLCAVAALIVLLFAIDLPWLEWLLSGSLVLQR